MAESNPTQVILTDDGIKIINAQNTADNAAGGVTNLNDPNLMSVIEKQNSIGQFAGLTSQYNVLVQNAKDDGIDTTAVTTAYSNLNKFMADILADPNHASDIDRVTYKRHQDAYNEELVKLQNALQNNTNDKFASAASTTSQAASTANVAKSAADSAYAYANSEIAVNSTATAKAQSTADSAFSKAQEVGSQASAEIQNNSTATAKAQSTADSAFSQAVTAIDNGKATSQAVTALKDGSTLTIAQLGNGLASKVSNSEYASYKEQTASQIGQMVTNGAFSAYQQATAGLISAKVATKDFSAYQATTAKAISSKVESKDFNTYKTQTANLINDKVSNSAYASDKTQTASEIADRVSNSAFSTYQTQTASQIASKVDNGDFSTYKTQTASLIASKVANKDFSAYQATTAKSIDSKVESSDFNTYKTQTAGMIASKVESKDFQTLQTQVDNSMVGTNLLLNTSDYSNNWNWNVTPSIDTTQKPAILHHPSTTITSGLSTIAEQNIGTILQPSTTYTASFYAKGSGNFIFYCYPGVATTVSSVNGIVPSSQSSDCHTTIPLTSNYVRYTITFTTSSSINGSKNFLLRQDYNTSDTSYNTVEAYVYGMKLEKGSVATDWSLNPLDQATQSQITQLSGEIDLRVTKGDLVDQINIQAGNTLISSSGQLTLSGKSVFLDSANPVIMKSANIDKLLVGKKLTAADISANTFTTNNGTFTVKQDGSITAKNMTLIGGTLTSPTINASTINGSTINGTTFNAGDIISSTYNTSRFYPTTITPAGLVATTGFNNMDGLRTEMSAGSFVTKYRAVHSSSNQYEAYDGVFSGDELALNSGFTNGIDMGFQQSVSGNQLTGQVVLSPLNGIHLWGSTQSIHFSGLQMNGTGITMNSYGNILADHGSTWWRVTDFSGSDIANFGTDVAGSNVIQFNRELDIGNIGINTAHSIISKDGNGLYINSGKGGRADLNVANLNYTGSVSKSLLSEKRDVKKVDTSYWAQLVNSIDLATYQYKDDDNTSNIRLSGIVDDVNDTKQWQLPDVFVARDEDGKLAGIENTVLQNAMLATIQEQQKEIDKLNGHLLELEAKLNG